MKNVYQAFSPILRRVSTASWLLRLVPIPVGIVTAKLTARIVSGATDGDIHAVLITSALLLSVVLGTKLFEVLAGIAYDQALSKAVHKCKITLYRRFLQGPLHILYATEHGEAVEHLSDDFNTVAGKSLSLYPGFFIGVLTAAAYFVFLLPQSAPASLVLLGISVLQIVPPVIVKKFMQKNYNDCRDIEAELTDLTLETYRGFAEIKLYGLKKWWLDRLDALHKRYLKIGNRSEVTWRLEESMDELVSSLLKYGTYGILGVFVLSGVTSLDAAVQAIALSTGLFGAVKTVFDSIPNFAVAKTAEERMAGWFGEIQETDRSIAAADIVLHNVSLSLDSRAILSDVSCAIEANRICLVKGANGIGKSTLLRLIVGLIRPDDGEITVGGMDALSLSGDAFPCEVFYLPQEDASFGFTARELYEAALPHPARAEAFARDFGLTDTLLRLDTLSGGERKKAFLSLAFAANPRVLLLDEPTNSLDEESKILLLELLRKRKGGAVIITHDPVFDDIADMTYLVYKGGISCEKSH